MHNFFFIIIYIIYKYGKVAFILVQNVPMYNGYNILIDKHIHFYLSVHNLSKLTFFHQDTTSVPRKKLPDITRVPGKNRVKIMQNSVF